MDPQMLVTTFLSDTALQHEIRFIEDMHALGGVVWAICEKVDKSPLTSAHHVLELRSNLSELARLPLYLPAVQYMAFYRAISLNLNPDEPRNLAYWIEVPQ